jgi:hypothetical protein
VGLAFAGLSSGTLALLASLSGAATLLIFLALAEAVVILGWQPGEARGAPATPARTPARRTTL